MPVPLRRPAPISKSSRIGILAPASLPHDNSALDAGIRALENRGLTVVNLAGNRHQRGYLSAPDSARIQAMNSMLVDPEIDAIFCVRGGYGSMRILDNLDFDAARRSPKLLVGYSDITALHCALYSMAGWTGIQGPMVAVDWPDIDTASESSFWNLASGSIIDPVLGPAGESLTSVRSGHGEGRLIGGNLAMFSRLLGTPFFPPLKGAILFLEEIGEAPYRVDAMFAQLRLSGVLEKLHGLVLGEFTDCEAPPGRPSLTIDDIITDYFGGSGYPVARGLRYGHIPVKTSMPFGVSAQLLVTDSDATLSMLESVTDPDFILS